MTAVNAGGTFTHTRQRHGCHGVGDPFPGLWDHASPSRSRGPGGLGKERGGTQPRVAWVYSKDEIRHMQNKDGKTMPHRPAFKE